MRIIVIVSKPIVHTAQLIYVGEKLERTNKLKMFYDAFFNNGYTKPAVTCVWPVSWN